MIITFFVSQQLFLSATNFFVSQKGKIQSYKPDFTLRQCSKNWFVALDLSHLQLKGKIQSNKPDFTLKLIVKIGL